MQLQVDPDFPYPAFFMIASRAADAAAPPAQAVGVLIVKQTVLLNGTIPPKAQQQEVLLTDEPIDPAGTDPDNDLVTFVEADLAAYKPMLDVVATRNDPLRAFFGRIRINRNDGNGFQPNPGLAVNWGWQSRVLGTIHRAERPIHAWLRRATPPASCRTSTIRSSRQTAFRMPFSTAAASRTLAHLDAGHQVEFDLATQRVAIPAGPSLAITLDGIRSRRRWPSISAPTPWSGMQQPSTF